MYRYVWYRHTEIHTCIYTNHKNLEEEHETASFSKTLEGTNTANTLILDYWPLELWDHKFLLFKPFSWWHYVKAALENYHNAFYHNEEVPFYF